MGKKKRKRINPEDVWWCYYCDKQFADSDSLIHHQKQRHFKCHVCRKTLSTAGGMVIHVTQVHKEQVRKVPYALKGRDDLTLNIVGMDGIPQELIDANDILHTLATAEGDITQDRELIEGLVSIV